MRLLLWFGVVVLFNLLNVMLFFHAEQWQKIAVLVIAPTVFAGAAALWCTRLFGSAGRSGRVWLVIVVGALAGVVGSRLSGLPRGFSFLIPMLTGAGAGAMVHYLLALWDRWRPRSPIKQRGAAGNGSARSGGEKPEPTEVSEPAFRPPQFTLRTLLMLPVLVVGLLGWMAVPVHKARQNRRVMAAIEEMGGIPVYRRHRPARSFRRPVWWFGMDRDSWPDIVGADLGRSSPHSFPERFGWTSPSDISSRPKRARASMADADLVHLKALSELNALEVLALQGQKEITDNGLAHLEGLTDLHGLVLEGCTVGDAGLEHLEGLSSLQYLNLRNTQVTDAGLEHVEGLKSLGTLVLEGCRVGNAGLKRLERLTSLEHLDLSGTRVTDAGLEHVKGLTKLGELKLNSTQVTDAGLERLQGLTNLREMELEDTLVTPFGVDNLRPTAEISKWSSPLRLLLPNKFDLYGDFRQRRLTDAEWSAIRKAVTLEGLELGATGATDAGLEHLKGLTGLEYLGLSATRVTDAGLEHLKGLTKLKRLHLGYTQVTDAGLEYLKGSTNLQLLDLRWTDCTFSGVVHLFTALQNRPLDEALEAVSHVKRDEDQQVVSADFAWIEVNDAALAHLKELTSLRTLWLGHNQVTDAGLEHLKGLANLERLEVCFTPVTDAGLEHLKGLTKLETLNLSVTQVTDAGVAELKAELPNCRIFHSRARARPVHRPQRPRRRPEFWRDATLAQIKKAGGSYRCDEAYPNRAIVRVNLQRTQVTDAVLEYLPGLTNLEWLDLRQTQVTDAGLEHLKASTSLQVLELSGTRVTDAGLEHLEGLTNLTTLDLSSTAVTDAGLEHVKKLPNLRVLFLPDTEVTDAGLAHLKGLTNLRNLSFVRTHVTDAGVNDLKSTLPRCRIVH